MEEIQGVLFLHAAGTSRQFTEQDLHIATAVAQHAGVAYQSLSFWRSQEEMMMQAIETVLAVAQVNDPDVGPRSRAMARVASAIATVMKLPVEENRRIQLSALLQSVWHVGSRAGEDALEKARKAEDILRRKQRRSELIPDVEQVEGKGSSIPVSARILAVAKAYQQSVEEGEAKSPKDALIKLKRGARKKLDSKVVEALMVAFRNGTLDRPKDLLGGL
jgi:HD-GYP domain-containing protein (c-di-GMP phosphodiesterase class II)